MSIGNLCFFKPVRLRDTLADLDPRVALDVLMEELSGEPHLAPPLWDWIQINSAKAVADDFIISTEAHRIRVELKFYPGRTESGPYSICEGSSRTPSEIGRFAFAERIGGTIKWHPLLRIRNFEHRFVMRSFVPGSSQGDRIWIVGFNAP